MGKSTFFRLVICIAAVLSAISSWASQPRPNVLFIAVDDLNDWIGCLGGHPQTLTPNFDRLAASGVLFSNAYCPAASCNPSRTAIMTGIAPHRSGLYTNLQKMRAVLPVSELMPKYFSRHGYRSIGSGKILHYFIDAGSWDDYFPEKTKENPFPPTFYPKQRPVNLPREPWMYVETDWAELDVSDEAFGGDWAVSQWVGDQLRKKRDQPLFLACGFYRPHEPWFVPKEYFTPFPLDEIKLPIGYKKDDLDDLPLLGRKLGPNRYLAHIRKHGKWKEGVRAYLASIHFADAMLGRVLSSLDEGPHRDNTIVVLWSDHGWHLGEKEHWQKFTGWRVCARVPLIIRVPPGMTAELPEGTRQNVRCGRPVSLQDLFPTLLQLCGLPEKDGVSGHSLLPLLRDPDGDWPHSALTHLDRPGNYAISTERFRYIHYADGGEELYDIRSDPHEWTNLADDPAYARQLIAMRERAPQQIAAKVETDTVWQTGQAKQTVSLTATSGGIPNSAASNKKTVLVFENRMSEPVKLDWVDQSGAKKSFQPLKSAENRRMRTYVGHCFVVSRSSTGEQLGYVVAKQKPTRVVIERSTAPPQ